MSLSARTWPVRLAGRADLPAIARVARLTWADTYKESITPENRHRFLTQAYRPEQLAEALGLGHWLYVAEADEDVVGFAHFMRRYYRSQQRAELLRLYVLPAYQSQGIGLSLLNTGLAALVRAEVEQCLVSVQASNERARAFYERHRFVFQREYGQFFGTQIIILVEYIRLLSP